ncbi:MAG: EpsG family protein [Paludibacter sp.]
MNLVFYALFFILLMTYFFLGSRNNSLVNLISTLLGALVIYLFLFNVTYNSDWDNYESVFYGTSDVNDFLFKYLSNVFYLNGLDYSNLYQLHIVLMGLGFIYFASRFNYSGVFGIISIYLMFQIIPLSNQIRYYVAFAFFLIAVYNFIIKKNYFVFAIFAVFSYLSHSGILSMYPFIYFFYVINSEKFPKKMIIFSLFAGLFLYYLSHINFIFSNNLDNYLKNDVSSLLGGIYNIIIWVLWLLFIYFNHKRLKKSNSVALESDVKYQFLYKLSYYSVIFIPIGLIIQAFAQRYVLASIIIWLCYVFYSIKYEVEFIQQKRFITRFLFLFIASLLYIFILPSFVFGTSSTVMIEELFMSNTTLVSLLN